MGISENDLAGNGGCCILRYRLPSKGNWQTRGIIKLGMMLEMHCNHTSERVALPICRGLSCSGWPCASCIGTKIAQILYCPLLPRSVNNDSSESMKPSVPGS
ncbi:uncharacterized protein VSU04_017157 isoform 1-T1 [Chlamydotis macqueenii]